MTRRIVAALGRHPQLTADIVQEAWADLQQLPTPMIEPSLKAQQSGQHVIEFGTLEDDDASPTSIPFPRHEQETAAQDHFEPAASYEPQPEMQLDEIQRHVDEAEQTYDEPAAETVVEPVANPFAESFEEEEVVVDSYAALQEADFVNAPRVSSKEGQQIAALLADVKQCADDAAQAKQAKTEPAAGVAESKSDQAILELQARQRQAELTEEVASMLLSDHEDESLYEDTEQSETIEMRVAQDDHDSQVKAQPSDDRDLIIIEQPEEADAVQTPALGKARRQKYRQLFNRLRQA